MLLLGLVSCGNTTENKNSQQNEETTKKVETFEVLPAGVYRGYDDTLLGKTENTVLFFGAEWCSGCVVAEKNFLQEAQAPEGMTLILLDYDSDNELKKKYGVLTKHTFVQIDANGEKITSWTGGYNFDDVLENLVQEETAEEVSNTPVVEQVETPQEEVSTPVVQEISPEKTLPSGAYLSYADNLDGAQANKILFFHADWCPSCIAADTSLSSNTAPENLAVYKVDYDTATELKKKYGVTGQHTFVQVDANGEMITKWAGGKGYDDIISNLK